MTNEIWQPVSSYECCYEVSTHGNVRSINRVLPLPNGKRRNVKGKLLQPKRNADGYLFLSLSKDGFARTCYIHRLVAGAFIANPGDLPEVNHLDGCKDCNHVENLCWVNHQQNVQHAYDNNLTSNKGGNHAFAVGVIDKSLGLSFDTIRKWAAARRIAYSTARNLLNNQVRGKAIDLTGVTKVFKNITIS